MLIYLDNDPNSKGSPNENFARELMELFTLGVNQYTQNDVVAAARAWTGHNVDYDATPRVYRFYPDRHDTRPKTFMGETRNWDGPEIITRDPDRRAAAVDRRPFHREEALDVLRLPQPRCHAARTSWPRRSWDRISTFAPCCGRSSSGRSSTPRPRSRAWCASPVEWIVTCLRSLGMTAVETEPAVVDGADGPAALRAAERRGLEEQRVLAQQHRDLGPCRLRPQPHLARPRPTGSSWRSLPATPSNQHVMAAGRRGRPRAHQVRPRPGRRARVAVGPQRPRELAHRAAGHRVRARLLVARLGRRSTSPP